MSTNDKLVKNDRKNLNGNNLNWDSAKEMAKDKKHWKNCCKKMSFVSKNLTDTV